MDHRSQQQNAVDRSKYGGGFATRAIGRAHPEGNGQFTDRTSISKIALDSINHNGSPHEGHMAMSESSQSSSWKAHRRPIKTLIHEEMSKEKKASQSSSSVIAKLMGLDSLPPPKMAAKEQKETRSHLLETSCPSRKDRSLRKSSSEHREFKDVFVIKDSMKFEKHDNQTIFKGNSHQKRGDTDVAFLREKFMEAKRLSTDGILQNSKEFNDAIEILDSNRDLLLKFLEEPNSLFTRHVHDSKGVSLVPHESHMSAFKSSRGKMSGIDEEPANTEVRTERHAQMAKDAVSSLRKPTTNLFNHLLKEHSGSLSHKLKSQYAGKSNPSLRSTRIVVLKPNLEKAQRMSRNVSQPKFLENYPFGYGRCRESQHSGFRELHAEGREWQNLFPNMEVVGQRAKGSREIAREIAKQMKRSVSSGSEKMMVSRSNKYIEDDNSCGLSPPHVYDFSNPEAYQRTPHNFDCWNDSSSPSTSCSTESPVSREARKRLCERWMMTNRIQEGRLVGRSTSTLGEMLAQSAEVPRDVMDSGATLEVSSDKSIRGMLGKHVCSRDHRKDDCHTNLPRSSSLSASSTAQGTSKPGRRRVSDGDNCYMLKDVLNLGVVDSFDGKSNQRRNHSRKSFKFQNHSTCLNPSGEENRLPVREIHVNQEALKNEIRVSDHSEVKPGLSKLGNSCVANSSNLVNSSLIMESMNGETEPINGEMPTVTSERHFQQSAPRTESSRIDHVSEVIQEASSDHPQVDSVPSSFGRTGPISLVNSKDTEQPSPVSVLEQPSEESEFSPECFERVSAGLQGLRMQLQLLRLESDQYNAECDIPLLNEDATGEYSSPSQKEEMLQTYRNDEDRDYSYLYDVLNDLGVHCVHDGSVFSTFHFPKHSVGMDVFEKLEKKYGLLVGWSKSERKLFFDLVISVLVDTVSSCTDRRPWLQPQGKFGLVGGCEGLVEETWQKLVRLQKEVKQDDKILDPSWLDLRNDIDTIGRDIEEMLKDDLLEELVCEFLLC